MLITILKKQKKKKLLLQNQRNKIINRYYNSTIKTYIKLFLHRIQIILKLNNKIINLVDLHSLLQKCYQILDKATKKKVIHKNKALKKKSQLGQLFFSVI